MSDFDKLIHTLFDESHGSERISKEIETADRMIEELNLFDSKKAELGIDDSEYFTDLTVAQAISH